MYHLQQAVNMWKYSVDIMLGFLFALKKGGIKCNIPKNAVAFARWLRFEKKMQWVHFKLHLISLGALAFPFVKCSTSV